MATLHVRNLSEEALTELKVRAARNQQSLQAYVRTLLEQEAATPSLEDVLDRIHGRATARLTTEDVLDEIDRGKRRE
ncbi:FitA-like ribbon-helix-helix domain-containing protein [Streptomyces litmocidini]|uniref:FitA-like ribbon-helix-helix domain-containing protein n=1 Tax=Streptomyces litmocidini TaxID=67318 RepID=A0ABW7U7M0_9ACTN